jgi:hypothetical protein
VSVTLKLADQDAVIIRDVLESINKYTAAVSNNVETVTYIKAIERQFGTHSMRMRVNELYGTFAAAVRANQR